MSEDRALEWYLDWRPGASGYTRDDVLLAVGFQCDRSPAHIVEFLGWLGPPDRVFGDPRDGSLVYFFEEDQETAAWYDVEDSQVSDFGTIMRTEDNARGTDEETGEEIMFNVLDRMEVFEGSDMQAGIRDLPSA